MNSSTQQTHHHPFTGSFGPPPPSRHHSRPRSNSFPGPPPLHHPGNIDFSAGVFDSREFLEQMPGLRPGFGPGFGRGRGGMRGRGRSSMTGHPIYSHLGPHSFGPVPSLSPHSDERSRPGFHDHHHRHHGRQPHHWCDPQPLHRKHGEEHQPHHRHHGSHEKHGNHHHHEHHHPRQRERAPFHHVSEHDADSDSDSSDCGGLEEEQVHLSPSPTIPGSEKHGWQEEALGEHQDVGKGKSTDEVHFMAEQLERLMRREGSIHGRHAPPPPSSPHGHDRHHRNAPFPPPPPPHNHGHHSREGHTQEQRARRPHPHPHPHHHHHHGDNHPPQRRSTQHREEGQGPDLGPRRHHVNMSSVPPPYLFAWEGARGRGRGPGFGRGRGGHSPHSFHPHPHTYDSSPGMERMRSRHVHFVPHTSFLAV